MRALFVSFFCMISCGLLFSQAALLQAGPMPGYSEMREVGIWVQLKAEGKVQLVYWPKGKVDSFRVSKIVNAYERDAYTAILVADQVEPGTVYEYELLINGHRANLPYELKFQTQELWQWRKDAPDFAFAAGSCFYINEEKYDRPGRVFGGDYDILNAIYNTKPDFMLWLGDNVYLREADWYSRNGYIQRYTHSRSLPELQPLLANAHHFATWDDHDYGPNDSDRNWKLKETAADVFQLFWANPPFDYDMGGAITNYFQWSDCDFYLLDDRFFKSPNSTPGTILDRRQIDWLKGMLSESKASFKFISVGVMFLSAAPNKENFSKAAAAERAELIQFIQDNKIEGVIFLTGDRHFAELSEWRVKGKVPIIDLTSSALTAGPASKQYRDEKNELRIDGTNYYERNFAYVEVKGAKEERTVVLSLRDVKGNTVWSKSFSKASFKP
jgi:alkaline phosphatase D